MGWKKWPYWLKGGIWFVSIYLLFTLLLVIPSKITESSSLIENIINIPQLFGTFIAFETGQVSFADNAQYPYFFIILINIIFYFVIGAIIGWSIGKIKSNKKRK